MNSGAEYLHRELTCTDRPIIIHGLVNLHYIEVVFDLSWLQMFSEMKKKKNLRWGNKVLACFLAAHIILNWLKWTSDTFVLSETQNRREVNYITHKWDRVKVISHKYLWCYDGSFIDIDLGNEGVQRHYLMMSGCLWTSFYTHARAPVISQRNFSSYFTCWSLT